MAGFEPAAFCSQSRHATKLRYISYIYIYPFICYSLNFLHFMQFHDIIIFVIKSEIKKN